MRILALAIVAALSVGTVAAKEDISKVNSSIRLDAGETAGDLETVNGGISLEDNARADSVETVNGGVRLGAGTQVQSVETVNGGVTLGSRAIVLGDAETVNGSITLEDGADVGGSVSNVNGGIDLNNAHVGGGLSTVSGDIDVGAGSHVQGGIKIEKPNGGWFNWGKQRVPRVTIGPNAVVEGDLVFERDVELYVHETARVGKISGAEAKRFSGDSAPR